MEGSSSQIMALTDQFSYELLIFTNSKKYALVKTQQYTAGKTSHSENGEKSIIS